eukprot:augustus_masked-scaffold_2-processed-gene-3.42-mRNA-1 protein AED:0.03 eAED:0.03 QI:0/-1/0/1/-1/1/1/0/766
MRDDVRSTFTYQNKLQSEAEEEEIASGVFTQYNEYIESIYKQVDDTFPSFGVHNMETTKNRFLKFIKGSRKYRDMIIGNLRRKKYFVEVDLEDLFHFDETLVDVIRRKPKLYLRIFEDAVLEFMKTTIPTDEMAAFLELFNIDQINPETAYGVFHVTISTKQGLYPLRKLDVNHLNEMVVLRGVIINTSVPQARLASLAIQCSTCFTRTNIPLERNKTNFGEHVKQMECSECKNKSLKTLIDECQYIDQQITTIQELPEETPTGEMPRKIQVMCERSLIDKVRPGSRAQIVGMFSVFAGVDIANSQTMTIKSSFLSALGIQILEHGAEGKLSSNFCPEEIQSFRDFSQKADVYSQVWKSVSPSITGKYTDDIKKAIAAMLFGGTRVEDKAGMVTRGDINVLLLGDPSVGKSAWLKYVEKVAPISVYTSGKGSSAAGLTASVIRDRKGDFYLEGGAMVLADGGVVCIDEFDKMRDQDRVAIHEAMEQQTISIAKAGITTVLNSRCSVLAAANPVFGTYNDDRTTAENIDFLPTILSRFDLIFIIKDVKNTFRDKKISQHILGAHTFPGRKRVVVKKKENQAVGIEFLKRYLEYARSTCFPTISKEAANVLMNHYVKVRQDAKTEARVSRSYGGNGTTVPITVRQFEALCRITEALARMELAKEASIQHAHEAIRLFNVSTVHSASRRNDLAELSSFNSTFTKEIQRAEDFIRNVIPIGTKMKTNEVFYKYQKFESANKHALSKAIKLMSLRCEVEYMHRNRYLYRKL